MSEPAASSTDLVAKLMGDWSWRPEMQPEDPGYVYTETERKYLEQIRCVRGDTFYPRALRPWMAKSYDYADLRRKPVRIGPRT